MTTESSRPRKIGPFVLDRELGVGGMGIVYLATYEKNGMKCAVKVLAPDLTSNDSVNQRFVRETEILKKLRHPHIIRYYGAGSNRTQRFYAMELLDGGSLDQVLKQEGRLSWEQTISYSLQIAKALEHAHAAGIIHRDLKPANLLLTKDGTLKLSDFGIARDTQATALTQAGKTVGTMAYMAPEQISGKEQITRRTDLYSLGCVMFEMLTGRVPFQSETQAELLFKHLEEPAPLVRDFNQSVPLWLSQLVDELLAKDPNQRPFDALAVQVRLEEIQKKVKEQETKLLGATEGGASALTQLYDEKAAKKKKKKKKKKDDPPPPFYERAWFLSLVLVIIVGSVTMLIMNSRSEETLYARAEKHMAEADPSSWLEAESHIKKLLDLYPDGERAEQAQLWLDQIEMYRAERRIETMLRLGRDPQTEGERLYVEAQQYERFGDRLAALEKYQAMPTLIESTPENRPLLNLAQSQAERIRASIGEETDRTAFIQQQLQLADELYEEGKTLLAREKWQAIVQVYGSNTEFTVYTTQARERLSETR